MVAVEGRLGLRKELNQHNKVKVEYVNERNGSYRQFRSGPLLVRQVFSSLLTEKGKLSFIKHVQSSSQCSYMFQISADKELVPQFRHIVQQNPLLPNNQNCIAPLTGPLHFFLLSQITFIPFTISHLFFSHYYNSFSSLSLIEIQTSGVDTLTFHSVSAILEKKAITLEKPHF